MIRTSIKEIRDFLKINGMQINDEAVQPIEELINTTTHREINERIFLEYLINVAQNCHRESITLADIEIALATKFPQFLK